MKVRETLGRLVGGVMVVALSLLMLLLFNSVSKGGIPAQEGFTPPPEPTGTFIVPTPVPIPTYTPMPTLPPSEFVVTRTIPLPQETAFLGWSPDGERILLGRWLGYHDVGRAAYPFYELWAANYDGSGLVKLAQQAMMAAWSPDGQYVAYVAPSGSEGPGGEIRVVDTRDLTSQTLTQGDIGPGRVQWLPGGEVAFLREGNIWAVRPEGVDERKLNSIFGPAGVPDLGGGYEISPDGQKIAYYYHTEGERFLKTYLWLSNLDGSGAVLISGEGYTTLDRYSWSPDSKGLLFATDIGQGCFITWIVDAHSLSRKELWQGCGGWNGSSIVSSRIMWSPDGKLLLYSCGRYQDPQTHTICIVDIDGTNERALDPSLGQGIEPVWSPDGSKIVFYRILPEPEIGQHIVAELARR